MKMKILPLILFLMFSTIYSQEKAKAYLNSLPELPSNPCGYDKDFKAQYLKTIDDFNAKLQKDLMPLKEANEKNYQEAGKESVQNYMKQFGLSQADVDKLKSGSKKDKDAAKKELADKIFQQKMNMTMADVEKLQKMSKKGQQAYAQGLAAEKAAEVQADPQAYKEEMSKDAELLTLIKERDKILGKINAEQQKLVNKMKEFSKFERKAYEEMDVQRQPLLHAIGQESSNSAGSVNQVKGLEDAYCSKVTPRYLEILKENIAVVKSQLADYEKLGKVYAQLNQKSVNVNKDLYSPDLMSLSAVEDIVGLMRTIFDYNLHTLD